MFTMKVKSLIVVMAFVVSSCTTGSSESSMPNDNWKSFDETIAFEDEKVVQLPLDASTGFWHYSMSVDVIDGVDVLSFINPMNNAIYTYDLMNSSLMGKTLLDKQGPNAVGALNLATHKLVSLDSMFIFNLMHGVMYLSNAEGKIVKKSTLVNYKIDGVMGNPEPSLSSPMVLLGNKLYISCSIDQYEESYKERKAVMTYDFLTDETAYVVGYPETYSQAYWGPVFKYIPSLDLGLDGKSLVANFSVEPKIQKTNDRGELLSTHYEMSSYIDKIEPLDSDIKTAVRINHNVVNPEKKEYGLTNSDFNKIISDPYRGYYYRVAYIRPTLEEFRSGNTVIDFSISVLTEDFKKIGEKLFDGSIYRPSMIFSGKGGLYIGRTDLYSQDEDIMPFSLFKL